MSASRKKINSISEIVSYTYPTLHTGKVWYIDFMAYDPVEQKMRRKKYNVPPVNGIRARKAYANEMIYKLSIKLREGWNPWVTATTKRQYTLYKDVIEWYHIYITKLHKAGSIKTTTLTDYQKRLKVLEEYTNKVIQAPPIPISSTNISAAISWTIFCSIETVLPEPVTTTAPGCHRWQTGCWRNNTSKAIRLNTSSH